jgi:hypothetical protein
MLAFGVGIAATAVFSSTPAQSPSTPVLTRAIPRTGEKLPVIGLSAAIIFDIGNDTEKRTERTKVIHTVLDRGARMIDNLGAARTCLPSAAQCKRMVAFIGTV